MTRHLGADLPPSPAAAAAATHREGHLRVTYAGLASSRRPSQVSGAPCARSWQSCPLAVLCSSTCRLASLSGRSTPQGGAPPYSLLFNPQDPSSPHLCVKHCNPSPLCVCVKAGPPSALHLPQVPPPPGPPAALDESVLVRMSPVPRPPPPPPSL